MQIFKSILCIHILLLTLLPCADAAEHAFKNTPENETALARQTNSEDDCQDSDCSVFCQCMASCSCAGNALGIAVSGRDCILVQQHVPISFSSLAVSPSKGFPGSSWRPPQI